MALEQIIDPDELTTDYSVDSMAEYDPTLIPRPPDQEQDTVVEGLGSSGSGKRPFWQSWRDGVQNVLKYIREGRSVTPGYCLMYTRTYYGVGPKYASAVQSGRAAKPQFRLSRGEVVPRGAIVYWHGPRSQYGHIAPSLGGGYCASTDVPRGRVGKVGIWALADAWGYTEVWWSPMVNDARVWAPAPRISLKTVNRIATKRVRRGRPNSPAGRVQVRRVNRALKASGIKLNNPDKLHRYDRKAVQKFQKQQGWTGSGADGLLGPLTLEALGVKRWKK